MRELELAVDVIFDAFDDCDLKEIANRTGLSVSTLHRLRSDHLTTAIRVGTVQLLAHAAGVRVEINGDEVRMFVFD